MVRLGTTILGVALLLGAACQTQRWQVPSTYVIYDIDQSAKQDLSRVLGSSPHREKYGFHIVTAGQEGEPFVFMLKYLGDMRELREVQELIQKTSQRSRVPVVLQEAKLTFASVYGGGQARIEVRGSATPGAEVEIDVGTTTVLPQVDADGRWEVSISRNAKLSQRGGWVYGVIRKGTAKQFIKMNVLDTAGSDRIRFDELPLDSLLRR